MQSFSVNSERGICITHQSVCSVPRKLRWEKGQHINHNGITFEFFKGWTVQIMWSELTQSFMQRVWRCSSKKNVFFNLHAPILPSLFCLCDDLTPSGFSNEEYWFRNAGKQPGRGTREHTALNLFHCKIYSSVKWLKHNETVSATFCWQPDPLTPYAQELSWFSVLDCRCFCLHMRAEVNASVTKKTFQTTNDWSAISPDIRDPLRGYRDIGGFFDPNKPCNYTA